MAIVGWTLGAAGLDFMDKPKPEPTISDILKEQERIKSDIEVLFAKGDSHFALIAKIMSDVFLGMTGTITLEDAAEVFLPKLNEFLATMTREQIQEMVVSHCLGALESGMTTFMLVQQMNRSPNETDLNQE